MPVGAAIQGGDGVTDTGRDRVTVQEAARRLGVSEQAVRKRVKRGTLDHEKEEDGRVYVYLAAGVDDGQDEAPNPHNYALISHMRGEIEYLREENRRKDEILAQQAMAMRRLSAPESPETASGGPGGGDDASEHYPELRVGGERRSWWDRLLGR
jgi:transposase-like protein